MKALSLSRPWPWAILHLGKRLENRMRKDGRMPAVCRHRGSLYLHAAQSWDKGCSDWIATHVPDASPLPTEFGQHPAGVIFARCRVVAHADPDRCVWHDPEGRSHLFDSFEEKEELIDWRWHIAGQFALVLVGVEPVPVVPCRGALGLWGVPADVLALLT